MPGHRLGQLRWHVDHPRSTTRPGHAQIHIRAVQFPICASATLLSAPSSLCHQRSSQQRLGPGQTRGQSTSPPPQLPDGQPTQIDCLVLHIHTRLATRSSVLQHLHQRVELNQTLDSQPVRTNVGPRSVHDTGTVTRPSGPPSQTNTSRPARRLENNTVTWRPNNRWNGWMISSDSEDALRPVALCLDRGYSERAGPTAIRLRYLHRLHRRREVRPRRHPIPDPIQLIPQIRLELLERQPVHPRRTLIVPHRPVRLPHLPLGYLERLSVTTSARPRSSSQTMARLTERTNHR